MLLSIFVISVFILVVCEVAEEKKQDKQKKMLQRQSKYFRRLLQGK